MNALLAELRRRNVIRMAGLYLVGAWLVTQVAGTILPMFGAPDWIARSVVILLAIGFIPALVVAWVFELTPQGLKRDADIAPRDSIAPQTARRMDRLIIVVLLLALTCFGIDRFVLSPRRMAVPAADASTRDSTKVHAKSIAVLPFTDLSPGKDQEYFSDGMAEELLNALAKVKDLKVAGRTSSFSFKGKNEDLRNVGKALGVSSVLEGSVRKQGDKVRITAQLIQTEDGFHLWSETYDGDMKDVFELQERIARSITDALKVVLIGAQEERIVRVATDNPEAYALYLQATETFNRRNGALFPDAIAKLTRAIELDPKFARAHARLAALHAVAPNYTAADVFESLAATQRESKLASDLDPTLAEPWAALGLALQLQRHWLDARAKLEQALALDPDDVTANFWYASAQICEGYVAAGTARLDRVLEIDPLLPNALGWRGSRYAAAGDFERARTLLQKSIDVGLAIGPLRLAHVLRSEGRETEATSVSKAAWHVPWSGVAPDVGATIEAGVFGDAAARARALDALNEMIAARPKRMIGSVPWALMLLGEPARAAAVAESGPTSNDSLLLEWLWTPAGEPMRRLPRFGEFARKMHLAELWDEIGPPDMCRRVAPHDYVCY